MTQGLADSALYINNEIIPYEANSLSYMGGTPERTVTPQVVGAGAVTNVVNEDFTTAKGEVKFELKPTSLNEELVQDWIQNVDANVVKIVSTEGKSRVFQAAVVINKPEFNLGSDGTVAIEIESNRAAIA